MKRATASRGKQTRAEPLIKIIWDALQLVELPEDDDQELLALASDIAAAIIAAGWPQKDPA